MADDQNKNCAIIFFLFDCIMNEQKYMRKKTGSFTDAES